MTFVINALSQPTTLQPYPLASPAITTLVVLGKERKEMLICLYYKITGHMVDKCYKTLWLST